MTMKILYVTAVCAFGLVVVASTSFKNDNNDNKKLYELLQQLREKLDEGAEEANTEVKPEIRTLHDDYKVVRYHGMKTIGSKVKASQRSGPGLTSAQQSDLVDAINKARRNEGANDMYIVRWNRNLAGIAQQWSDACQFTHGAPFFDAEEIGFYDIGQNNYAFTGPFNAADTVRDWMSEKPWFDMATNECKGKSCDRYTQLVWSYTTDVGCGLTECSSIGNIGSGNFLVCYFGPPGEFFDEKPYIPGTAPCSQCKSGQFYCNNGLCDATCSRPGPTCECKSNCKNCASATSDCKCRCNPGSFGVDCSRPCLDSSECGTSLPLYLCEVDYIGNQCPKSCVNCVPGNPCAAP